jgi:quercetin dioxygenase-like cupin family protein
MSGAVDFGAVPWANEGPGIRARAAQAAGSRWAIVEYAPRAEREEWCTDGHRGYVVEGAIEYQFEDGSGPLQFQQGQGFVLAAGTGHRGRNPTAGTTRLFLIDDPE